MRRKIICSITAVILLIIGKFLLRGDYLPFLQWWAIIFTLGIIFVPFTALLFANFHDKGYLFSKAIGIAVTGYLMWLLSTLHVMKFTALNCIICTIIGLILNVILIIGIRNKRKTEENRNAFPFLFKDRVLDHIIAEELMFFALFLLLTYIRGFKPEAYGTEKFMDYGFMTSMMRSEYMPPQDFWYSGTKLNYYYVGQYIATFLTKLSFVKVKVGYNLALMMVGTLAFVLPYSLVYNITSQFLAARQKKSKVMPTLNGLLGGIAVCFAGNMHYPTFKWFEYWAVKFFGIKTTIDKYWFPDATRFIGYHPDTHDKTIHEFPCYSFVLGDLHAHVINIMFVVTVLGILFAWLCARRAAKDKKIPIWKEVLNPCIIMISFFIGLFHMTNFWDFPIYFVVSGAIILFTNLIVYNFKGKAIGVTALQGLFVIGFSYLTGLPFTANFHQISTNICLTVARTPLNQLFILWGLPIFVVIAFLCFTISNFSRRRNKEQALAQEVIPQKEREQGSGLTCYMESLTSSDLFIITIGLCAIGLVLIPEIIYVQDIYSGDYKRANTMFKLTYQAFIMFGICFGYILTKLLAFGETRRQKKTAVIGLILFTLTVCYVQNAVNGWYGNIFHTNGYKGQDCTTFMVTNQAYKDDVGAIKWLNDHVSGMPVILEANGDSYTDYERVSVMTGLPTVLGWRTHEWLWKGSTDILDERTADVKSIYTATAEKTTGDKTEVINLDREAVIKLIKKYNISYIYVGKLEQDKFSVKSNLPNINHELLKSLGDVVYSSPATGDKSYETYIVKLQNLN
jgi:YYY domain-containing protein